MEDYSPPRYDLGFSINGTPIPDPTEFDGLISDLDTMAERDATGELHREMVATKYPVNIAYKNLPWDVIMDICPLLNGPEFQFTFPSPAHGGLHTIRAYSGDRKYNAVWLPTNAVWIGDLSFDVREY